jgi:cob(I)alamin adenosyltransferase
MKIYTKIGDGGKTTFFGAGLVEKDDPRIEVFGSLDELNSVIGVTLCFINDERLKNILLEIQNDLFQVGADIAGSQLEPHPLPKVNEDYIHKLEKAIDEIESKLGIPNKFILPGGTPSSAFLHLCRAVTRRAERNLVSVKPILNLNPEVIKYINRLSDFLFILARQANKEQDVKEQQPIYRYFEQNP